jgi:surface polysaccharide O-acyltransferase-like enzyme
MFMVVALHASGLWFYSGMNTFDWNMANAINSFTRPAVPFFFMITGYLLCGSKQLPFIDYMRKRFSRILPSFIFVTVFAILYRMSKGESFALNVLWQMIYTPQFYHLWFFYAISIVYLGVWLFRPSSNSPVAGALGCLALIFIIGGSLAQFVSGWTIRMETLSAYIFYAMAGYYIGRIPKYRFAPSASLVVGIACLVFIALATRKLSLQSGSINQFWYEYTSFPVVVGSFFLFYGLRHVLDSFKPSKAVEYMSSASLFVYCFHPFIIDAGYARYPQLFNGQSSATGVLSVVLFCVLVLTLIYTVWGMVGAYVKKQLFA